jgi:hypothetical protein
MPRSSSKTPIAARLELGRGGLVEGVQLKLEARPEMKP